MTDLTNKTKRSNFEIDTLSPCDYEELSNQVPSSSNNFNVIQQNIRGLTSKLSDIKYLIDKTFMNSTPDCILLCETWLKANSSSMKIDGYDFVHTDHVEKRVVGWAY